MSDFISKLVVGAKLGSGHFGEVHSGTDPAHGHVAVKVLSRKPHHTDITWPKYKSSYLAEARNLSSAEHRNVVKAYHVTESKDGNSVYICMAYCSGGSLQSVFESGPMPLSAVRKAGTEVSLGLGVVHARGMIHRDIKPANILINKQGEAQIGDFGLVTDDIVFGYASQAGYNDHIAYEVWKGKGTSVKSDVWALGMTLYRLLHGKEWYERMPSPQDIVEDGGFADRLIWLPHIPKKWRRFIRKMLNDSTSARYQNMSEVLSGIASLPVSPPWSVTTDPSSVRWEQIKGTRRLVVEWHQHSTHGHEWSAVSEPLTSGRNKKLGGSSGIVKPTQAIKELELFFKI